MQISRHWRLSAQRYRLEGFRNPDGTVSLQPRPAIQSNGTRPEEIEETREDGTSAMEDFVGANPERMG